MADLEARSNWLNAAVEAFVERVADDRTVLAVIRLGSGRPETLWNSDSVSCWVVVADGTRPRRSSDGDQPRVWRTYVENDVDIHAELIERAKLKRMVEGNDRSTAGFSWFSDRTVVHCADPSLERWFATMQTPASRDQRNDQLSIACWIASTLRRTRRRLDIEQRTDLAIGDALELAFAVACLCVVDEGEVVEHRIVDRAVASHPDLMAVVYTDLAATPDEARIRAACDAAEAHLVSGWEERMAPVLRFIDRIGSAVPLSELCEHFATSALHPGPCRPRASGWSSRGTSPSSPRPFRSPRRAASGSTSPATAAADAQDHRDRGSAGQQPAQRLPGASAGAADRDHGRERLG